MIANKILWGILGCGDVTEVKSGPAFNLIANSEISAVMRRDPLKAEDYAKRHGVRQWYSNAGDLINDSKVNAIYIATPPAYHEEYTIASFKAGKSVYVEKPMALNTDQCIRMMNAASEYSCKLTIAHYRRAQSKFLKIRKLIKEQIIGDLLSVDLKYLEPYRQGVENTWRVDPSISGGGLFHDLAPHQLDLMIYFFGNPLSFKGHSANTGGFYNADDYVTGEIYFQNDLKFTGVWDFNSSRADETDSCVITGTKGEIRFQVFGNGCVLILNGRKEELEFAPLKHVQEPMIAEVVSYFLDKAENPCPPASAIEVTRIMDSFTGINRQNN